MSNPFGRDKPVDIFRMAGENEVSDDIIEAAARALMIADVHLTQANAERVAVVFTSIIEAAITPLIRAAALEEAAKVSPAEHGAATPLPPFAP